MKKYQIIYADPPWTFNVWSDKGKGRSAENHYPVMKKEEIQKLPITTITDKNCILFLWATAPCLIEALELMKIWGFEYKTQLVWDKEIIGLGYWFRGQHELLLVGTKGDISSPRPDQRISSVYKEKRTEHSKKPDKIRGLIKLWYPKEYKIELFARQKTEGWDVWGNEVESDIDLEALKDS